VISCTEKAILVIHSNITTKLPSLRAFHVLFFHIQRVLEEENFVFKGWSRKAHLITFVLNILHIFDKGLPELLVQVTHGHSATTGFGRLSQA
jgi:hypothetical protein